MICIGKSQNFNVKVKIKKSWKMTLGGRKGQNFSFLYQDPLGRKMVYMDPRGPYLLVLEMF
jgi:hypothetical protein